MTEITRKSILAEAEKCVCHDREGQYGSPENNFSLVARLWREYLDTDDPITAHDVAMMMALLKVARIATGKASPDNYIDLAGYAACAGEIACRGEQGNTEIALAEAMANHRKKVESKNKE